jgi:hypothetical protein
MQTSLVEPVLVPTLSVPGAKVTTSGKAHDSTEITTTPRPVLQKSNEKNARPLCGEDHSASRPEMVKLR